MRRHAKASSVGSSTGQAGHRPAPLRLLALLCLAVGITAALTASSASAAITHPYSGLSFGPDGTTATSFSSLQGVAVDQASGNVFVFDAHEGGKIYKFDSAGNPVNFSALTGNVIEGVGGADNGENQIAVAPAGSPGGTAGDIYAAAYGAGVSIFSPSGEPLGKLSGSTICGIATNAAGHVFAGVYEPSEVREYTPSANPPVAADQTGASTAALPEICNVATDGLGNVYAATYDGTNGAVKLEGLTAPSATQLDPAANTLAVDPATNDVYANRRSSVVQYDSAGNRLGTFGAGRLSNSQGIAVNGASEEVYVNNGASQQVDVFGAGEQQKATVDSASVIDVTQTEATLQAQINPQSTPTTYHFEYGTDTTYGQSTPEGNVGSDETAHKVSVFLQGLTPGTTYHWRVVATNSLGVVNGPDRVFRTFTSAAPQTSCPNQAFRTGASAQLLNCRAYEMVSPVEKNNTDIYVPYDAGAPVLLDQVTRDGEKLAYTTSQGFGDAKGAAYVTQYVASRSASGWSSHAITAPQGFSPTEGGARLQIEDRILSADLCQAAAMHMTGLPLAPGAVEGFYNLYHRQNCGKEGYTALTTTEPSTTPAFNYKPEPQGLSADGGCIVFRANAQLTPEAAATEDFQVYEGCRDAPLRLVSLLPDGTVPGLGRDASVGTFNVGHSSSVRDPSYDTLTSAVSTDGSRIYWTEANTLADPGARGALYLRVNAGRPQSAVSAGECTEAGKGCTIPISTDSYAHFWAASADGSVAFFDEGFLGKSGDTNLFQFDLTSGSRIPIASEVVGIMGASQDASRIAFVSKAVLSSDVNSAGAAPAVDSPNLYLYDAAKAVGSQFQFVGTLSENDARSAEAGEGGVEEFTPINNWPAFKTSRVSPDGRHLAFMSDAALTGYDNTDSKSGRPDAEIFAYDSTARSGEGQLRCVSCIPSGELPSGRNLSLQGNPSKLWAAAFLTPNYTTFYGSHVISDDGQRVYFDSYNPLLPVDTNGKADVYEWQAPGSGSCSPAAPSYSPLNEGCISLISSGTSSQDSKFVDATPDGRDVFIATAASLLPQDPGLIDIYDAREGGGYPPAPAQPAACEGEACQGPLAPPNDPTPASAAFNGAGDVKPSQRHHRKKAKHKKRAGQKKHQHRGANNHRRNAR